MNRNEHIKEYLDYYITSDSPRYAILIKGVWGCGKTHFISNILENWNTLIPVDDDGIVLKPVYVSLNGVEKLEVLSFLIKKELSPFLYSKSIQTLKKVLFGVVKLTTKVELGEEQDSLSIELEPIKLFSVSSDKIKGNKVLIFDDLERCKINIDELFGYVNNFVEHCGCKVIFLGDENKIKENYVEDKLKNGHYENFKEKLIGRTFVLEKDTAEALKCFVNERTRKDWTFFEDNFSLIFDFFEATETDNLRILRQCLKDFERFEDFIDENFKSHEKYNDFLKQILVYFIIVYIEFKNGNSIIIDYQSFNYFRTEVEKDAIVKIDKKYLVLLNKYAIRHSSYTLSLNLLLSFVEEGFIDKELLNTTIQDCEYFNSNQSERVWEKLWEFHKLSNVEFSLFLKEVKIQFYEGKIDSIPELLHISGLLLSIEANSLDNLNRKFIVRKTKRMIDNIIEKYKGQDVFNLSVPSASFGKEYSDHNSEEFRELIDYARNKTMDDWEKCGSCAMRDFFEDLNDQSLSRIAEELSKPVFDRSKTYEITPIFKFVSAEKLACQVIKLSNEYKIYFRLFLARRYYLPNSGCLGNIENWHKEDYKTLAELKEKLAKKKYRLKLIDKMQIKKIIDTLNEIITKLES